MMTKEEAAAMLDGNQYRKEGSKKLFQAMARAGLVAVFGASDDLMEFEGAVSDEIGAPGIAHFNKAGLIQSECDDEECPYFAKVVEKAATVECLFAMEGFTFTYKTEIPHATFIIKEDDENYCRGIVFALADVPEAS